MGSLPLNPTPAVKARNPQLYPPNQAVVEPLQTLEMAVSTDEAKLNKTERDFLAHLRVLDDCWIGIQCITLKLGDDCRYTPDFWEIQKHLGLTAYEVKGFWRDDAKVKIKVAARMYPWLRFVVVRRGPNELVPWLMDTVKP